MIVPEFPATAESTSRSWATMASRISFGDCSQSSVELTMSVSTNVTVPSGSPEDV